MTGPGERKRAGKPSASPSRPTAGQCAGAFLVGLLVLLWAGYIAGGELQDGFRFRAAQGWPSAEGVVEKWTVEEGTDEGRQVFTPFVSYLYVVDGQLYRGSNRYLHDGGSGGFDHFPDKEFARQTLARYPVGKDVKVYYDPVDPADAALELTRRSRSSLWVFPCLSMAGALWLSWRICRTLPYPLGWTTLPFALALAAGLFLAWRHQGNAEALEGGFAPIAAVRGKAASEPMR